MGVHNSPWRLPLSFRACHSQTSGMMGVLSSFLQAVSLAVTMATINPPYHKPSPKVNDHFAASSAADWSRD